MAGLTSAIYGYKGKSVHGHFEVALEVEIVISEVVDLANRKFNDNACVTTPIGTNEPNNWD